MRALRLGFVWIAALTLLGASIATGEGILIDHQDTDLTALLPEAIGQAKAELHIGYGHTSHGSQVTDGMTGLVGFINGGGFGLSYPTDTFAWNRGGTGGALDLHDYFKSGDLGNPDRTTWAGRTRDYLDDPAHDDVNVILWSWCGQADTSAANIDLYLNTMNQLEIDYPRVSFVYMTGHVNGCSTTGNLFYRNQQIRDYCLANEKILYDFADIESYDPNGAYYGDKRVTDDCWYDSDSNGSRDRNWASDYQDSHVEDVDWYDCDSAHSEPLNANQKAYAAWALWTQIAQMRRPSTLGDTDCDGDVDCEDYLTVKANLGTGQGAHWAHGDFDRDRDVDRDDLLALVAHYAGAGGEGATGPASTPEPATLALLAAGALVGIRRKRTS